MTAQWDTGRYLGLFVAEATEHLEALSKELVRLEGRVSLEAIDSLFRHAHSVKGMASSMGFETTTTLAHRLEDLLDRVRSSPWRFDGGIADYVLQAVDALQGHVKAAAAHQPFPDTATLAAQLETLASAIRPGTTPLPFFSPPPAPMVEAAPPPPVDLPPRYLVAVKVAAGSTQPGVRGFLAYKRLSTLGTVSRVTPPLDDIKAGKVPGRTFSLELETPQPEDAVRRTVAQVADVDLISLQRLTSPTPVPAAEGKAGDAEGPRGAADAQRTVRVRTELLDGLLDLAGELLVATVDVRAVGRALPAPAERSKLEEAAARVQRLARSLSDKVIEARMTPVALITDRLPRTARDIARRSGREIELSITGADIELDRAVADELSEPVLHLLRNAIDHGVEPPDERKAAGKLARGTVKVAARRATDRVVLEVSDDGRGMNVARLKDKAVERGLVTREAADALGEREALMLSTLPGLSTADAVTDISGRGVGMDSVKRAVEAVGGTLEIETRAGAGTTFRLSVPATVGLVRLLLLQVGEQVYGLPLAKVAGVVEVPRAALARAGGGASLEFGKAQVPARELAAVLGVTGRPAAAEVACPWVVVERDEGRVALAVDALMGQEDVVLKGLTRSESQGASLAGVTMLANGTPVSVLDAARLGVPE